HLVELLASVDHAEQPPQRLTQAFPIRHLLLVRQGGQELHIPNQVCQAKLKRHATLTHVTAIGAETIAAQNTIELPAQHLNQYIATACRVNLEQRVQAGAV